MIVILYFGSHCSTGFDFNGDGFHDFAAYGEERVSIEPDERIEKAFLFLGGDPLKLPQSSLGAAAILVGKQYWDSFGIGLQ